MRRELDWRKNYRVWEANRRVFLYPENYLEPESRNNKTPIFKELEDELLQRKITKESAEEAYSKYLAQFAELAQLVIGEAIIIQVPIHIISLHTLRRNPPQYYYRKYNNKDWTPWEKIGVAINADRVSAIIYSNRLYLFWVERKFHTKTSVTSGDSQTTYSFRRN